MLAHLFPTFGHQKSGKRTCSKPTKVDEGSHPTHLLNSEAGCVLRDSVLFCELGQGRGRPGKDSAEGEGSDGGSQGAKHLPTPPCLTPRLHFSSSSHYLLANDGGLCVCPHDHIIAAGTRRTTAHCCTYTEDPGGRGTKSSLLLPYSGFLGFSSPASSVSEHRSRLTDLPGLLRKTAAALLTQPCFAHLSSQVHFSSPSCPPPVLRVLVRCSDQGPIPTTTVLPQLFQNFLPHTDSVQIELTLLIIS